MGALILIAAVLALAGDDDAPAAGKYPVAPWIVAGVCNPAYALRIDNCTHVLPVAGASPAAQAAQYTAWVNARFGGIGTTAQEKEARLLTFLWEACPQCNGKVPEAIYAGGAWRSWAEFRSELERQDAIGPPGAGA